MSERRGACHPAALSSAVVHFLRDNAMQVSGLLTVVVGGVLVFAHLTTMQTAWLGTVPSGVAQFLVGVKLKNGKAP